MLIKFRLCGYHTDMSLGPGCIEGKMLSDSHCTSFFIIFNIWILCRRGLLEYRYMNWCHGVWILSPLNRAVQSPVESRDSGDVARVVALLAGSWREFFPS